MARKQRAQQQVQRHDRAFIAMPDGGALKLALVADTHSQPNEKIAERLAEVKPDRILHAGDIGDLSVLDALAKTAPVLAVRGNIDVHAAEVPDSITIDVKDDAGILVSILLMHIAVYGPKLRADAVRLANKSGANVVVCGHSHVPFVGRDRGLTVFNPGSIGPRRFQLPICFGVMDIARTGVSLRHVSCETGEAWRP
jgi:putative phosphoesterase